MARIHSEVEVDALLVVVDNANFIPCPKLTLSVDAQQLGNCGICHESQLLLRPDKMPLDDNTVAILPCGHIAGYSCLRSWFSFHRSCPFCRMPLEYQLCKHSSDLIRPLTRENLYSIPETVPFGGLVPSQCFECSVATNTRVNKYILDALLEDFRVLRAAYHAEKNERKRLDIKRRVLACKTRMDRLTEEISLYPAVASARW